MNRALNLRAANNFNPHYVVIVTCERLQEFIVMLVAHLSDPDAPPDPLLRSKELQLVNDVLASIWRNEVIDWMEYSIDPSEVTDLMTALLGNHNPSGIYLYKAYAITVPDLTGTLIFHFKESFRSF